ncbi:hypothetical protein IQ244_29690 [Nostoc sp. LEGE 06077]|uniref:hypothetical protein n=1 Tax=Nostoc sp. LEGE 06077 TaxID=915325 RepID=UPI00187F78EC|nr:hypothetical protein [Nostoc sp. LEGE 06077]MBE9210602.1 hypothetical protein [Nostoc sp. LEGE 06077]
MQIANCFGWQYGLLPDKTSKDIVYLSENEIQQLSPQESEEDILAEIDEHLNQLAILQEQLKTPLQIKTPFGEVKPKIAADKANDISRRSAA